MAMSLSLEPQKEAKLITVAESKGMTANELVNQAIDKILSETLEATTHKEPTTALTAPDSGAHRTAAVQARLPDSHRPPI